MGIEAAVILGGLSAGASFAQASAQNSAASRAAGVEKEQSRISANERRTKLARELQEFSGSLRTTSAARGATGGGSSAALQLSAISTSRQAEKNVNLQETFGNAASDSRKASQFQNPFFSGFSGGLSGFQTGFSLDGIFE